MKIYIALNVGFIVTAILYIGFEPYIKKNQRKYILGILIIVFSVLMAMRPLETKDTLGYIRGFERFEPGERYEINFLQKYAGYELGYIYLIQLFKCFSDSYQVFFFLIALVGTTLSVIELKKMSDRINIQKKDMYGPIFAVYISNFGLLYNGISVRAGLAMGIGITAVNLMLNAKKTRAVFAFMLAFVIQRSSALFVLIYLIIRFLPALKKKIHTAIWAISGIMLFSGFGSWILRYIAYGLNAVILRFQISGYGAFLTNFETGIGRRDIYLWLLYGLLIMFSISSEYYNKYLNVIMFGALIIIAMHDVRAIARAYDMFYMFMVPTLGAMYNGHSSIVLKEKKLVILAVICINALLMLRLCFA